MGTAHKNHDDALADVIWWLKGFAAANRSDPDPLVMKQKLMNLRVWLNTIGISKFGQVQRVIGRDLDKVRIVLTETEFDQISDGFIGLKEDRQAARKVWRTIRDQYDAEIKHEEAPF